MRMTLSKWASANFEKNSKPCQQTLWKMCKRGDIPGAFQDKANRWWVSVGDNRVQKIQLGIDHVLKGDAELQGLFS